MWKFLLIATIGFYVFYKISSFFFKAGAASQQLRQQQSKQQQVRNGEKKNKGENIKGGEYVDYEEVK